MTEQTAPQWQSIEQLPLVASLIDEMVEGADEHYGTLREARTRLYVLDDYTVQRVVEVFTTQQKDLSLFEEQLQRWRAEVRTSDQRREVARLGRQLERLRVVIRTILTLAEELKERTIEKLLAKSDFEVGLEMLLGEDDKKRQKDK